MMQCVFITITGLGVIFLDSYINQLYFSNMFVLSKKKKVYFESYIA